MTDLMEALAMALELLDVGTVTGALELCRDHDLLAEWVEDHFCGQPIPATVEGCLNVLWERGAFEVTPGHMGERYAAAVSARLLTEVTELLEAGGFEDLHFEREREVV